MPGMIKVGRTDNPRRRLREARCFNPGIKIETLWELPGDAVKAEATIHAYLAAYRSAGEWFDTTRDDWFDNLLAGVHAYLGSLGAFIELPAAHL